MFLAYLIDGAERTQTDGYPIIEKWMIADEPPEHLIQWDRRCDVKDPSRTGMCFYCNDENFQPILNNPRNYVDKLRKYKVVVGIDASPYDNMPIWVQKSQIGLNLGITYYYGSQGIKVIPNVRIGSDCTISSLEAYPHSTLIAIGTNGFVQKTAIRKKLIEQIKLVIDILQPKGICFYGPTPKEVSDYMELKKVELYSYDSYTMTLNRTRRKGGTKNERL